MYQPLQDLFLQFLQQLLRRLALLKEDINAAMKAAANESFGYNEDEIVSSDIVGMRFGSLFDATQTMVNPIGDDLYEVQVVFLGMITRTATHLRWFVQSSTSLS